MAPRHRLVNWVTAGAAGTLALAVNPLVVRTVTGRADLPFRVSAVCWSLSLFMLAIAGAALAQGRARRVFVYLAAGLDPALP